MRSRLVPIAAVAAIALIAVWWLWPSGSTTDDSSEAGPVAGPGAEPATASTSAEPAPVLPGFRSPLAPGAFAATVTVSGQVLDLHRRTPVPEVDVVFRWSGSETTATSAGDGRYSIRLAPGVYDVGAYGDDVYAVGDGPLVVGRLDPPELVHDVYVSALATVTGRVLDGAGGVIEAAEVSATSRDGNRTISSAMLERHSGNGRVSTTADGRFTLKVASGDVALVAAIDGAIGRARVPGVAPGVRVQADIVIDASAAVAGRVVDETGTPVSDAEVFMGYSDPVATHHERRKTPVDESGRFALENLRPGTLSLQARSASVGASAPRSVTLESGQSEDQLELVVVDGGSVSGRVITRNGDPVADAHVSAARAGSRAEKPAVKTEPDGTFVIAGLDPGGHLITASARGYARAIANNVVPPADGIELVLMAGLGIRGVVRDPDGRPIPTVAARVVEWTSSVYNGTVRTPSVATRFFDDAGGFELEVTDPGSYFVEVSAPGYAPEVAGPIEVPVGGWGQVEVTLEKPGTVRGRVVSASTGQAVADARVSMDSGHAGRASFTDDAGRFTLTDVASGRRSLVVSHPEYMAVVHPGVEVKSGEAAEIEVELISREDGGGDVDISGVGVVLLGIAGRAEIRSVVPGGPAARARLRRRDAVVAIDGNSVEGLPLAAVAERMRGPAGTVLTLTVSHAGRTRVVTLTRARVGARRPVRGLLAWNAADTASDAESSWVGSIWRRG